MKAASAHDIKAALKEQDAISLTELCLRLIRYKKENKELLTFLLFEADDLPAYIKNINEETDDGFGSLNRDSPYWAKKGIRKILRGIGKHNRYAGSKTVEVETLLHFCTAFKGLRSSLRGSPALANLYATQLKKIKAALDVLHEDLQHDYRRSLDRLIEA